jgi:hypothetical protein
MWSHGACGRPVHVHYGACGIRSLGLTDSLGWPACLPNEDGLPVCRMRISSPLGSKVSVSLPSRLISPASAITSRAVTSNIASYREAEGSDEEVGSNLPN